MIELAHLQILAAALFSIGLYGVLARRSAVLILMSIELMLNAVNLSFLSFSRFSGAFAIKDNPLDGHVFVVFVLTVAAAEAAVALALSVLIYRRRETVDLDRINLLRW